MRRPPNLTGTTPPAGPSRQQRDVQPPADYLDFYGLSKPPFDETSDSTGYILFGSHRRAFELLVEHIVNGSGLVLLLGPEGVGKTETLRAAAASAAKSGRQTILVSRPPGGRVTFNQLILALHGTPVFGPISVDEAIRNFQHPPRKVIIADDVELMPDDCITLLLSLEQPDPTGASAPTLIMSSSIELMGDPARPDLAQLSSLARNTIRMGPLAPADVGQYIERRLWIVGGMTRRLISPDGMKVIVARSAGRPGTVNRLMEAAFTAGFARGDTMITAKTLAAATGATVHQSPPQHNLPQPSGRTGLALPIIALGLLAAGLSAFLYKALTTPLNPPAPVVIATPAPPPRPLPPAPLSKAETPPAPKPVETLPPDVIAALIKRGNETFELGDISAARLLYQRAAAAGNAAAATALAKTYDPAFSPGAHARDPERAAEWYQKAIVLGDPKAADLLKRLAPR